LELSYLAGFNHSLLITEIVIYYICNKQFLTTTIVHD